MCEENVWELKSFFLFSDMIFCVVACFVLFQICHNVYSFGLCRSIWQNKEPIGHMNDLKQCMNQGYFIPVRDVLSVVVNYLFFCSCLLNQSWVCVFSDRILSNGIIFIESEQSNFLRIKLEEILFEDKTVYIKSQTRSKKMENENLFELGVSNLTYFLSMTFEIFRCS